MEKSTKQGRPFIDNPKTEQIHIRVTKKQKETIINLADKENLSVSELVLKRLKIK